MSPWLPELKNSDLTLVMHVLDERPVIPRRINGIVPGKRSWWIMQRLE